MVEKVASEIFIPFSVGGGISTVQDMRAVLLAGAEKISVNSAAVKHPEIISQGADAFGSQAIVAVSYTHLDVYKRQAWGVHDVGNAGAGAADGELVGAGGELAARQVFLQGLQGGFVGHHEFDVVTGLSLIHICVAIRHESAGVSRCELSFCTIPEES